MALTRPKVWDLDTNLQYFMDPLTVLHQGATSANVDVGFLMNRANGLVSNVAIYWSESTQSFVTAFTANTGSNFGNILPTTYANITTGNLLPGANVTYNLGSPTQRWNNLWLAGTTIYLGGATISSPDTNTVIITNQNSGSFSVTGSAPGQSTGTFGNLVANSGLISTSTTSGALQVTGGTGITGNLYVGGNLDVTGTTIFRNIETVTTTEYVTTINATNLYASTIGNAGATLTGTLSTAAQTNITSVGTLTSLTVSGNLTTNGYGYFGGVFNESATTGGVFLGNTGSGTPSPRLGLFNGTASQNWQIDNYGGTFRWFTPGVTRMQLDATGNLLVSGNVALTGAHYITSNVTAAALQIVGTNSKGGAGYHDFLLATNLGGGTNINKWFRLNSTGGIEIINSAYTTNIFTLTDGGTLTVPAISAGGSIGTNGQVLSSTGSGLQWVASGGFSGGSVLNQTTFASNVVAASGTVSTSTTTGALVVVGGVGITGNIYLSGNVVSSSTGAWTIPTGNTAQRPGAASQGMIRYNSTISSFEGYGAGSAWSSLGGVKSVDGFATITAEAIAGAGDDVLRFYSGSTGSSVQVMWASASNISILPTTVSTSTTTGALQVAGGVGISGNVNIGGITSHTGNVAFDGQQVTHYDSIIDIHTYGNLAAWASDDGKDIGLRMHYYKGSDKLAFLGWENTTETLQYLQNATEINSNVSGTFGNVQFGSLLLSNTTASTSTTTGALVVSGGAGIGGNLYVSGNINVTGTSTRNSRSLITNYTGATAPVSPQQGDEWYNSSTDIWYKYFYDGTGYSWVDQSIPNAFANLTLTGTTTVSGNIIPSGNVLYNLGSTSAWWSTVYGKAVQAQYADLAEKYLTDAEYTPGTVVVFGGDKEITVTDKSHDPRVAGVISTNPAYLMNSELNGLPVAFTGRVPCLVQGPIKKGELLVTSNKAGVAQAIDNTQFIPGCVIGKSLENITTKTVTTIEVVVGRF